MLLPDISCHIGVARDVFSPRISKNDALQTASEAVSRPINGCAAQSSGHMSTLEVKTGSCSNPVEKRNNLRKGNGNLAECSTDFERGLPLRRTFSQKF